MKTVDGVNYVQVPEVEQGNCTGCVAQDPEYNDQLCEILQDENYCSGTNMIYKKEIKMIKLDDIIRNKAVEILEEKLEMECASEYSDSQLDIEVDDAISEIEDLDVAELIRSNLSLSGFDKREFVNEKFAEEVKEFICIFDCGEKYLNSSFINAQARTVLEENLTGALKSEDCEEVRDYFSSKLLQSIENSLGVHISVLVVDALESVDDGRIYDAYDRTVRDVIEVILDRI